MASTMVGKYKSLTPGSFWHLLEELMRASNGLSPFLDKAESQKQAKHSFFQFFVNHQPSISRAAIALAIRDSPVSPIVASVVAKYKTDTYK